MVVARKDQTKVCEQCGKTFYRTTSPRGDIERPSIFARRRFCGNPCSAAAKSEKKRQSDAVNHLTRELWHFSRALR